MVTFGSEAKRNPTLGENPRVGIADQLLDGFGGHRTAVDLLKVGDRNLAGTKSIQANLVFHVDKTSIDLGIDVGCWNADLKFVLNPSARVSVTCMASIFFRSGPAGGRVVVNVLGDAVQHTPVVRRARPGNGTRPPKSFAQTKIALVRAEGLEPPQLSSLEPKPSASTSSATPAQRSSSGGTAASGGLIA